MGGEDKISKCWWGFLFWKLTGVVVQEIPTLNYFSAVNNSIDENVYDSVYGVGFSLGLVMLKSYGSP